MTGDPEAQEAHAPGAPARTGTIPVAVPNVSSAERDAVLAAIDAGFVSSVGPQVAEFEKEFASLVGSRHAVATSSGTAALHVAMHVADVGPGDEVFVSDFTFIGSSNPVAYQHADVVLVDSDTSSWTMDPSLLEAELARRAEAGERQPKAIELVHILGQPADAQRIGQIAAEYGVMLIEDAAESLGAGWVDAEGGFTSTGTVGALGAFSFNGNKIVTAGGGGMIVTNDDDLAARARHLSTQAKVPDVAYLHDDVGYNYRLTNLSAAFGLAQLRRLPEFVSAKLRVAQRYDEAFADLPIETPPRVPGTLSTFWLYSILLGDERQRDDVASFLADRGIGARAVWRPLHLQPPLAEVTVLGGSVAEGLFRRGLSLPCSTGLTASDQDRVIEAVRDFFDRRS